MGYHQHYGGNNEYSYCNLLRRMDKICHSDKPHCTVTSGACGLCRNQVLCERLAGRTGILLTVKRTAKFISCPFFLTVITLKKDYLSTLSVGKHTLTIVYNDGECSTEFEIKKASTISGINDSGNN